VAKALSNAFVRIASGAVLPEWRGSGTIRPCLPGRDLWRGSSWAVRPWSHHPYCWPYL